jgi:hypothetical protein
LDFLDIAWLPGRVAKGVQQGVVNRQVAQGSQAGSALFDVAGQVLVGRFGQQAEGELPEVFRTAASYNGSHDVHLAGSPGSAIAWSQDGLARIDLLSE